MKYHIDSVLLAEQSLLGALMQEPEKLIEVKATVDPEDFYDEKNKDQWGIQKRGCLVVYSRCL